MGLRHTQHDTCLLLTEPSVKELRLVVLLGTHKASAVCEEQSHRVSDNESVRDVQRELNPTMAIGKVLEETDARLERQFLIILSVLGSGRRSGRLREG